MWVHSSKSASNNVVADRNNPADAAKKVAAGMDERMSTLLGFAGSHRYGPHPYISGPVFATEYTVRPRDSAGALGFGSLESFGGGQGLSVGPQGYPGDATDYGAGGLYDEEGGVVAEEAWVTNAERSHGTRHGVRERARERELGAEREIVHT